MSDAFIIILSIAAIAVCVATVMNLRCLERRMEAEYERRAREARRHFEDTWNKATAKKPSGATE